jgi:hypothetical protein
MVDDNHLQSVCTRGSEASQWARNLDTDTLDRLAPRIVARPPRRCAAEVIHRIPYGIQFAGLRFGARLPYWSLESF